MRWRKSGKSAWMNALTVTIKAQIEAAKVVQTKYTVNVNGDFKASYLRENDSPTEKAVKLEQVHVQE